MKFRIKEQGSALHVVILIVLIVAVLGLLSFVFWQNFLNKDSSSQVNTIANPAPTAVLGSSEAEQACANDTNTYDLFIEAVDSYVYENSSIGLSFSYPEQWGTLVENEEGYPSCVGPLRFSVGKAGVYGGGDDPLLSVMNGYFSQANKHYMNWSKDSEDGPYELESAEEIPISGGNAALVPFRISVNLKKSGYDGLGIHDKRETKEIIAQYEESGYDVSKMKANYENTDLQAELKYFAATLSVSE
jgi:hypothetical protein